MIKKALAKFKRKLANAPKADLVQILTEQLSGLEVTKQQIEFALQESSIEDVEAFARALRKASKPILIAANKIDLKQAQENFVRLQKLCADVVPTSAEAEITLKTAAEAGYIDYLPGNGFELKEEFKEKLNEKQRKALEFLRGIIDKYGSTGVQLALNKAVFELLGYIAVYPVADCNKLSDKDGRVLPDVFLVPAGTTVKELAFQVHTELGERFICGIDARSKQKLSADHELKHGDVVEIRFAK